jgi:pimeloyl-ACP methyl ester carboxylesterase
MSSLLQRAIGILLMLTALAVPLMQAPDRPVESLVARWALPPSDFMAVRGQWVHVRDVGPRTDPSPIVLLHGTGASLHTWEGWVAALQGQHRVITLDLPGFGLTGPFTGQYPPDDYRGDTLARFVLDVLDTLKLPRVVLGGNSLGGEVAWRLATLAPQRVARLVLVDAAGYAFAPESQPIAFRMARIPALSWLTENLLPRAAVAASVQNVYGDPDKVTPELVDRYHELTLRSGNRHALGLRLAQMQMGQDSARIATLKLPTLILWGGRDRLTPPALGQRFARDIAGSRLVVFDGLGHVPQEEDPARTVAALREFLARP